MLTSVYMENLNCEFECMMEWVCVLSLCVEVYEMSQERSAHAIITEKAKIQCSLWDNAYSGSCWCCKEDKIIFGLNI